MLPVSVSLSGQHVLGNLCRLWFVIQAGETWFSRALAGPRHPDAGTVNLHLLIRLVLQEQNESPLLFSTRRNKTKIMANLSLSYTE